MNTSTPALTDAVSQCIVRMKSNLFETEQARTMPPGLRCKGYLFGIVIAACFSAPVLATPALNAHLQIDSDILYAPNIPQKRLTATGAQAAAGILLDQSLAWVNISGSGGGTASALVSAQAQPGFIKMQAISSGEGSGTGQGQASLNTIGQASFVIPDVIISGPGQNVSGSFNLMLNGAINTSASYDGNNPIAGVSDGRSSFQLDVSIGRGHFQSSPGELESVDRIQRLGNGTHLITDTLTNAGLLSGYTGGKTVLHVPFTNMPVGQPLSVMVSTEFRSGTLVSGGAYGAGNSFSAAANAKWDGYALSFPINDIVFNLPNGYTVNSIDGNIMANRWTPSPVPEASNALLLVSGLSILFFRRRRRTRSGAGNELDASQATRAPRGPS